MTKRFEECCEFMDIGVLDHIIVGEAGDFYSFLEHGLVSSKVIDAHAISNKSQASMMESEQAVYKRMIR